jgi:hypothetical protein
MSVAEVSAQGEMARSSSPPKGRSCTSTSESGSSLRLASPLDTRRLDHVQEDREQPHVPDFPPRSPPQGTLRGPPCLDEHLISSD